MLDQRTRIVRAAADLLAHQGKGGVSTRTVSAKAGLQAPAIYRQFADMQELLVAAAREVFAGYMRSKAGRAPGKDPIEDLRLGWDEHVAFGVANPAAYVIMHGESAAAHADVEEGYAMLEEKIARVAAAGLLRTSVPHAARMYHAGGCGVTLTLISTPPEARDARLSESMREAVLAAITTKRDATRSAAKVATRAVALRAVLAEDETLTPAEGRLMNEWLDRLSRPK